MKLVSDNRLAREAMDWAPAVSLDEGLLRTIEFVRKNPDFYRTDGYVV
jgi:dTDP-glucose 4,6-dehydratase